MQDRKEADELRAIADRLEAKHKSIAKDLRRIANAMPRSEEYNCWSNHASWCVNLWLSNDEGTYHAVNLLARSAWTAAHEDDEIEEDESRKRRAVDILADNIRGMVENDEQTEKVNGTVYADLLSSALQDVDWHEIAEAWLGDVIQNAKVRGA